MPIPEIYLREMIADWMGAGLAQSGKATPHAWYEKNKYNLVLHDETRAKLEVALSKSEEVKK